MVNLQGKKIYLLCGMAGIANVGKIVLNELINFFHSELMISIYHDDLPNQVLVDNEGLLHVPSIKIYSLELTEKDVLILMTSDFQPVSNNGVYTLVNEVINYLLEVKHLKLNLIISTGAYVPDQFPKIDERNVYISGTSKEVIDDFLNLNLKTLKKMPEGIITGANGIIPSWGEVIDVPGACLLAEAIPMLKKDPIASKNIIILLSKFFKLDFDYSKIDEEIRNVKKIVENLKNRANSFSESRQNMVNKDSHSYIG
ncbi:MAG: PAC2 family protein [Promethearchaeota archaeon]